MCSQGTSCPSAEKTRFCWILPPSLACSMWKRTSLGEVAEKSFTGTLTSPKLMEPLQMGRGIEDLSVSGIPAFGRGRERVSGLSFVFQDALRDGGTVLSLHDLEVGALRGGLILHGAGGRRARAIFRRSGSLAGRMGAFGLAPPDGIGFGEGLCLPPENETGPGEEEPGHQTHP